ncbi:hypothetical protein [uncultured Clostridium sp.]|uniref:hypothetical protein n=1 Tax=uncultured Clostridium sp. TaxID=59620 RepID=UPI0025886EBC|nr:hypothetical protein [uncultured Clostridium sp.]
MMKELSVLVKKDMLNMLMINVKVVKKNMLNMKDINVKHAKEKNIKKKLNVRVAKKRKKMNIFVM